MAYNYEAVWGDWFHTTTHNDLTGKIIAPGVHTNGTQASLAWTLDYDAPSEEIHWIDDGGRWDVRLTKIAPTVWRYSKGSHPYLVVYEM